MQIRKEQIKDIDINQVYYNDINLKNLLNYYIPLTLYANLWNNNEYIIESEYIQEYSNGQLTIDNISQNELQELLNANIKIKEQNLNQLILSCDNQPTIDLNIILILN